MAVSTSAPEPAQAQLGDAELRAKQMQQAEELLFAGPSKSGFAKALFRGEFRGEAIFPYPELPESQRPAVEDAVAAVRAFADAHIDAAAIDRDADIPRSVIDGLAHLGVLGMAAPPKWGGRGFSQMGYCRIMEVIGGHCASTAVFVNAHHSIGLRALVLFGTPEQQERWLPSLASGEKLAAFALTEEQAGSDAANVQTTARPADDGRTYILNGSEALHHQRGDCRRAHGDGPHARPEGRRLEGHRISGHARHARVRDCRSAHAQVRHPRHGHGTAGVSRHARAGRQRSGPAGQGPQSRAHRARLRPHDLRRELHRSGQGLPRGRDAPRGNAPAVRPAAGRPRADQEEARLPRRNRLRHGSHHLRDRRLDRQRCRGLHARDGHPQGLLDRGALARELRDAAGLRRPGLLQQRTVRAR